MFRFNLWNYVSSNLFSSPENQINLLISEIEKMSKIGKHNNILDVGGGLVDRGNHMVKLGKRTVVDIVDGPNVDVVADAHKLPFNKNTFEIITSFMVLEHLYNPILAIEECKRVLKPNGLLALTTVQYWHSHGHPHDYYRYTREGLIYLCKNAGLKVIKIWSVGGPALVIFHAIECNLPGLLRKIFLLFCPIFNYADLIIYNHGLRKGCRDSVGWAVIAQNKE